MSADLLPEDKLPNESPNPLGVPSEHCQRIEQLRTEATERRTSEVAEQRCALRTPGDRVQIWERLHQLRLQRRFGQPLITIIATDTSLTEVQAEERA